MCSTYLVQRESFSHLLSLFASVQRKDPGASRLRQHRAFLTPCQSAQFSKHSVVQRLPTARIKEALPFNFSMIVTSFLAPQSRLRSLNHFLDSVKPKVATQRGPRLCDPQEPGHTSWLYLFLWEISRSSNLALADPRHAAITLRKAPCNYKHNLLFISGQNENACEYDGLLHPGR